MFTTRLTPRAGRALKKLSQSQSVQVRHLNIHEYQAQELLRQSGALVAKGDLARTPEEAQNFASSLGSKCVLKSQVLSGGRGKGRFDNGLQGGIQRVDNTSLAGTVAAQMLGHKLFTKQSAGKGLLVDKLYVTEHVEYKEEYYLAMTIDRSTYSPALIVSKQGGMNIEEVAKSNPDSLHTFRIDYKQGPSDDVVSGVARALNLDVKGKERLGSLLLKLYNVFKKNDATLIEINPLVRTTSDDFLCLDAKVSFDNAAAKRQPEIFAMKDNAEDDAVEAEADKAGLVYVRLEGNIGNVVNGAGLAMATNDAISFYGGSSANFLDAGGQATTETMVKAFEIILRDPRVKVILVNIYGGIIRCDMIAESIISAAAQLGPLRCPIVVRLQGTNAEEGQRMVADSGLNLIAISEFGAAAQRAVEEALKA